MRRVVIEGGRLLLADALTEPASLTLEDGWIGAIGGATAEAGLRVDAAGLIVAPGLVDIHGDAFERQIQPRPGVEFGAALALLDTDRQLLANGITTAFHAITLSWEPGLRSEATFTAILDALAALQPRLGADHRLHLRLETHAVDQWPTARRALETGAVHLLALNDHTGEILRAAGDPLRMARYAGRAKVTPNELRSLAESALARAEAAEAMVAEACATALARGIPIASHDDPTPQARSRWRALGALICEFPKTEATGRAARDAGEHVVMGCPNVVRGGSHLGWHAAEAMVRSGAADVLASDYFYPAMRQAAFALADRGACTLAQAWALVSANAAKAARLADRGRIEVGLRADLVLLDPEGPAGPEVVATLVAGRVVWLSPAGIGRLA